MNSVTERGMAIGSKIGYTCRKKKGGNLIFLLGFLMESGEKRGREIRKQKNLQRDECTPHTTCTNSSLNME